MNQEMVANYEHICNWMYRNARPLELSLWQYFFEKGRKETVVSTLMFYQNEDGGFGHALEADNWNPNSSPVSTEHALKILMMIEFDELSHPIYQGILKYLNSGKDLLSYGWRFTIPSNDGYPHAPWWDYSEEQNIKEYIGVTASFTCFILKYCKEVSELRVKAEDFAKRLIDFIENPTSFGDMGIASLYHFVVTLKEIHYGSYDYDYLLSLLAVKMKDSIEYDTSKWSMYGVRPSNYICSPDHPFYEENKEIVLQELDYMIQTLPKDDVWPITWTWFNHMQEYEAYFRVSENWWKAFRAIEGVLFLRNFGRI